MFGREGEGTRETAPTCPHRFLAKCYLRPLFLKHRRTTSTPPLRFMPRPTRFGEPMAYVNLHSWRGRAQILETARAATLICSRRSSAARLYRGRARSVGQLRRRQFRDCLKMTLPWVCVECVGSVAKCCRAYA